MNYNPQPPTPQPNKNINSNKVLISGFLRNKKNYYFNIEKLKNINLLVFMPVALLFSYQKI